MSINKAELQQLSALIDYGFELADDERAVWLATLAQDASVPSATVARVKAAFEAPAESTEASVPGSIATLVNNALQPTLTSALPATLDSKQKRFGPYQLERLIAQGGMGDVWLAQRAFELRGAQKEPSQEQLSESEGTCERESFELNKSDTATRQVALKLPHIGTHGWRIAGRFNQERLLLARLNHPNIAAFYDSGTIDRQPYLALEYVDGVLIRDWCKQQYLDIKSRVRLFLQVLDAVQYAHNSLIIHRDLKPGNIMVTAEGRVKLLDFGIAKALAEGGEAEETELTKAVGRAYTSSYASPEQILGKTLTTSSDLYSLGVVLFELLTGERPYRPTRSSPAALEEAILSLEPLRLRQLDKRIASDLEAVVMKALSKSPQGRYSTCQEMAEDLRCWLNQLPVRARKQTLVYRMQRFLVRNRLTLAVISVAVVGLSFGVFQYLQKTKDVERTRDFLLRTLTPVITSRNYERLLTTQEQFERSAKMAVDEFKDRPAVSLELLDNIADNLRLLGEIESSIIVAKMAVNVSEHHYGPQSHDVLKPINRIADSYALLRDRENYEHWIARARQICPLEKPMKSIECQAVERIESQYLVGAGQARDALARWNLISVRDADYFSSSPLAYRSMSIFAVNAARATGNLQETMRWYNELFTRSQIMDRTRGDHWYALAAVRTLAEFGHTQEALQLATKLYQQALVWRGPKFDSQKVFLNAVAELHFFLDSIDMRRPIEAAIIELDETKPSQSVSAAVQQRAVGLRVTLALKSIYEGEYDQAEQQLRVAMNLYNKRTSGYSEYAKRIELYLAWIQALRGNVEPARSQAQALLVQSQQVGAIGEAVRAEATIVLFETNVKDQPQRLQALNEKLEKSGHRIPDIMALSRRMDRQRATVKATWQQPAPTTGPEIDRLRTYVNRVLEQTQLELDTAGTSASPK